MAIELLKILEMVLSQNKRRTGNWVVFSSCDSVGMLIYSNCRKPAEQKEKGELKPLELQNAEELILSFREFSPKCMQQRSAIEKAQGNLKR